MTNNNELIRNTKNAICGIQHGHPLKDYMDEDELIEALEFLLDFYTSKVKAKKPKKEKKEKVVLTEEEKKAIRRERAKKYHAKMKEDPVRYAVYKEKVKKYHAEHKDQLTENMRRWYEKNKEAHLEYMKEYLLGRKDILRQQARERHAKRKAAQQP